MPKAAAAVPLYQKIYLALRDELFAGMHAADGDAPDRALPGENDLARRFGVSRETIRRALETLESEGLVVRRHGVGTFPTHLTNRARFGDLDSLYADLAGVMEDTTQQIIFHGDTITPAFLRSAAFGFGPRCFELRAVTLHAATPVHIRTQYVPARTAQLIEPDRLESEPLLLMLLRKGVKASATKVRITAAAATQEQAARLHVPVGSPLIVKKRISEDAGGGAIEYFEGYSRPDLFEYSFSFKGREPKAATDRTGGR
jgi:GntR family transcriptional regulator